MHVACLHTVESNIAVFDAAARAIDGLTLSHTLRADLLARAEEQGALTAAIRDEAARALEALSRSADAVLLTCSTLGPASEAVTEAASPVLRVDEALAVEALGAGGRLVVLCAAPTTMEPTRALFARIAEPSGGNFAIQLVEGAWARRKAGDLDGYYNDIAAAIDRAYSQSADHIALAQATMAEAAERASTGPKAFTSPSAGLLAAANAAHGR
ncbi:aspartate/glutamate racemase family protein [Martelella sp. HB161492]|uniref:aspartate/glutamate racemase family protein n=1 Tax=Martelella sp. HB161492 TaxID=2720726 RepID=UPI00159111C6|nr:aspartate/glutamate racemase family protein [Martelella sp. HB161492]